MIIYAYGKQYYGREELKETIRFAWSRIKPEVLVKLCKSQPKRCADILDKRANEIAYY